MRTRIRTVKPEIHKDEELWDLEQQTGLPLFRAFVGLMNCADREGRFEWRPRALKADVLPFWDGDFARVLDALTTREFIVRYTSGTREYGVVRTFLKHQNINNRESPSELPPPPQHLMPRVFDASATREVHAQAERNGTERNGNGREGNGAGALRALAPVPELDEDEAEAEEVERLRLPQLVRVRFERRYLKRVGKPPSWTAKNVANCKTLALWLERTSPDREQDAALLEKLLTGFFTDAWATSASFPLTALANDPARYLGAIRDVRRGYVEAAPADAFQAPEADPDDLFGPRVEPDNDARPIRPRAPQAREAHHG